VDDHDLVRGLIAEILTNAGFNTLQADSGDAALAILRRDGNSIGCILQDMSMPGLSGPETIARTLELLPDARIIVLSVDPVETVRRELKHLKVQGYLEKPCDSDILLTTVRSTLV